MRIRTTLSRDMLAHRRRVHMGTIPIIRMPARPMVSMAPSGSLAESSSVPAHGAGVGEDIGVVRATGDVVVGVAQAGVTDAATLVDTGGAMPEEHTDAVTPVADITEAPFAEAVASTGTPAAAFMGVVDSTVEADTAGADIVAADTGNRLRT